VVALGSDFAIGWKVVEPQECVARLVVGALQGMNQIIERALRIGYLHQLELAIRKSQAKHQELVRAIAKELVEMRIKILNVQAAKGSRH
jgi:Trm5-related predicted tRNA methylase